MSKVDKYIDEMKPNIEFLKTAIKNASSGEIIIKTGDLANSMKMTNEYFTSIYRDIRYTLFKEGIVLRTSNMKGTGEPVLIMRKKMEGDTLERINMDKFKDITISSKDDFLEFIPELPDDLKCSELIEIFGFEKFVEKIYFETGSCGPENVAEPKLSIKLMTSAKISDVIEIFKRMKPDELGYDEKTHTIDLWFD